MACRPATPIKNPRFATKRPATLPFHVCLVTRPHEPLPGRVRLPLLPPGKTPRRALFRAVLAVPQRAQFFGGLNAGLTDGLLPIGEAWRIIHFNHAVAGVTDCQGCHQAQDRPLNTSTGSARSATQSPVFSPPALPTQPARTAPPATSSANRPTITTVRARYAIRHRFWEPCL